MIDTNELFGLIRTGAIETYKGQPDVLVDIPSKLVFIGQGERLLVLSFEQTMDLIGVLLYKLDGA